MKEKVQAPELRFDGFTDDWELRKLTNITSSYSGLTYSPTDIQDTGTFVLRSSNVKNDQLIDADNVYVNPDIVNSINVKVGDVIIVVRNGSRALIGKHAIVNEEMPDTVIGAFMSAFRGENGNYINALLSTDNFQKEVHKSLGATINQITGKDFSMMIFPTPKFGEQQKIGAFFKQLDYTIALHQRKLDLLKEQKKGYLQKMFPKNGAKVPELRFAGFADDWEERKLNEVSDIYDGTHQTPKYQDNGVMFLSVENIKTLTSNKFISREAFEDEFKIRPQRGDVLMTRIGDIGTANVVETDEDLAYYVSLALFKSEELNPYFLQASIYAPFVQDQIWKRTLHIAFPKKINKNEIGQVPINVPTLAEQTKIGSFFKQLDNTITLHQRKLDLLKEQKKGFLQKMFV
ncbi:MAG: restriction endonuclease subunit S [Lactococcus raffinolactis]